MADYWIDVTTSAGVKVGAGPIRTATSWQNTRRLDRAGEFSFEMPASDSAWLNLAHKYLVYCYTIQNSAVTNVGAGIIERIEVDTSAQIPIVRVSGTDLLGELTTRTVGDLVVCETGETAITVTVSGTTHAHGSVHWIDEHGTDRTLDSAFDGSEATESAAFDIATDEWLYIGFDARFDAARFVFHTAGTDDATARYQYFNTDGAWTALSGVSDGTIDGLHPLGKNGTISWTRPTDWARLKAVKPSGNWFWVRIGTTSGYVNNVKVDEIYVTADKETTNGINLIMAFAPVGWTVDTHTATTNGAYLEFAGETVLDALIRLARVTGDHFRAGSGRVLSWICTDYTASTFRAVRAPDEPDDAPEIAIITDLKKSGESSDIVSYIIPYGSGSGKGRVTLQHTTKSAVGYVLYRNTNKLVKSSTATAYGQIERVVTFDEVGAQQDDSFDVSQEKASDQLFDAAKLFLDDHSVPLVTYTLSVAKCIYEIKPGYSLHVVWQEWVDSVTVVDINTYPSSPLYVLGVTEQFSPTEAWVSELEVGNVPKWPPNDEDVIASIARATRGVGGHRTGEMGASKMTSGGVWGAASEQIPATNTTLPAAVGIYGGSLDGVAIGQTDPGPGDFTDLDANDLDVTYNIDANSVVVDSSAAILSTKALYFDGSADCVTPGDITEVNGTAAFSFAMWFRPDAWDPSATRYLFVKNLSSVLQTLVYVDANGHIFGLIYNDAVGQGYGYVDVTAGATIGPNLWSHLVVVYDGSQADNATRLKIYLNGAQPTLTFIGTIPATAADLTGVANTIGYAGASSAWLGFIRDFRIYSAALTQAQIDAIFTGSDYTTNMVHQWLLTEGTGTTATDTGSNPLNGTISGASWSTDDNSAFGTTFARGRLGLLANTTQPRDGVWFGNDNALYRGGARTVRTLASKGFQVGSYQVTYSFSVNFSLTANPGYVDIYWPVTTSPRALLIRTRITSSYSDAVATGVLEKSACVYPTYSASPPTIAGFSWISEQIGSVSAEFAIDAPAYDAAIGYYVRVWRMTTSANQITIVFEVQGSNLTDFTDVRISGITYTTNAGAYAPPGMGGGTTSNATLEVARFSVSKATPGAGLGAFVSFGSRNSAHTFSPWAYIEAMRDGADNRAWLAFYLANGGTPEEVQRLYRAGAWAKTPDTATTTVTDIMTLEHRNSSGTPAAEYGTGLLMQGKSSTTDTQNMARIAAAWQTATHASRNADLVFSTEVDAGASLSEVARMGSGLIPHANLAQNAGVVATNLINFAQVCALETLLAIGPSSTSIKGLWFFDEAGATTTLVDRSVSGHNVTLSGNASTLSPGVRGLCQGLLFGSADYWDTPDHNDFSFGDGAGNDVAFSVLVLVRPTAIGGVALPLLAKYDTTGNQREWILWINTSNYLYLQCTSPAGAPYIGRYYNTSLTGDNSAWHVYAGTYSGSKACSGIKVYRDGVQVDTTDYSSGTYTTNGMTNGTANVGSYYGSSSKTCGQYRYGLAAVFSSELGAAQILRMSNVLLAYAGNAI